MRETAKTSFDTSEDYLGRQLPLVVAMRPEEAVVDPFEALTIEAVLCKQSKLYCSCKVSVNGEVNAPRPKVGFPT
jgi:hypothetical protein